MRWDIRILAASWIDDPNQWPFQSAKYERVRERNFIPSDIGLGELSDPCVVQTRHDISVQTRLSNWISPILLGPLINCCHFFWLWLQLRQPGNLCRSCTCCWPDHGRIVYRVSTISLMSGSDNIQNCPFFGPKKDVKGGEYLQCINQIVVAIPWWSQ